MLLVFTLYAVAGLIGYIFGSLSLSAVIFELKGVDRFSSQGSGSVGATNAFRLLGWKWGITIFAFDVFKGLFATLFLKSIDLSPDSVLTYIAGTGAILGHSFSPWVRKANGKRFGGGKSVATTLGVVIALSYPTALVGFAAFVIILAVTRIVSVSSTGAVLVTMAYLFKVHAPFPLTVMVGIAGAFIMVRHASNYKRLMSGEELLKRFEKLPQLGKLPIWLIPRYWMTKIHMLLKKPDAETLFTIHVIGEGEESAWRGACTRFPWLTYCRRFIPKKLVMAAVHYVPYWMRYMGACFVEVQVGDTTKVVCVHVVAMPWNTLHLTDAKHPLYKAATADMNKTMVYFASWLKNAKVLSLGAGTAFPNLQGMKLPEYFNKAGISDLLISNGNSFTAFAAMENILWARSRWEAAGTNRQGKLWHAAVVGAAGSVGSGLVKLMRDQPGIWKKIFLVGRDGNANIQELIDSFADLPNGGIEIVEETLEEACKRADVVVLATNSPTSLTFPGQNRMQFVVDVGKPANSSREMQESSKYLAFAGSIMKLPGRGRGFGPIIGLEGFQAYACCAEGVVLALLLQMPEEWIKFTHDANGNPRSAKDMARLFLGHPDPAVAAQLGSWAKVFGIMPCDRLLNPHTNRPIRESKIADFMA